MSAQYRDIWPLNSEFGGHNRVLHFRMGGSTTSSTEDTSWQAGEALLVDATAGDINASIDGAVDPSAGLSFIATASSSALLQTWGGTSGASTHAILVPVFDLYDGSEFVTRNIFNNSDTNLGPNGNGAMTGVFVGVNCGIWVSDAAADHVHGLDINGSGLIITRILDSLGRDTALSGGTPHRIVFRGIRP